MTRRAPLLWPALAFAAGIALHGPRHGPWPAAAALPLALWRPLAPVAFAAAGDLAAAAIDAGIDPTASAPEREETLEGRVAGVPERLDGRVRFALRERDGRLVQVAAPPCDWPLAWGDEVRVPARTFPPEPARNPGGRDAAALLAARGIASQASARLPPVRVAPPAALSWLEAGRSRLAAAADRALPPRESALVRAIGTGDRSALDPATVEAFARSGLAHLLSVSGLHLAVVALGAWRAARALLVRWDAAAGRVEPRRAAAALALPVAGLYALATGADVPVVRSALAAGLGFAGILLDRESRPLPALSLGLLAVLAADPGALLDVSTQLSFASVAGLALLSRPLRAALPWRPPPGPAGRAAEAAVGSLAASLAAALATAPLVAFHFRRLSLLSPLANLVGVPLGSALTLAAAAAAAGAALWPPLALPFLWVSRPLAWLLLRASDLFAAPGLAALGVASPGPWGLAACGLGLAGALATRGRRRAALALLAAAGLALPGPARQAAAARRGLLEVVFLSVGQGDAALLRLPDGAAVLVDGGGDARGRADPGARDVLPFLRDAGVRRLWLAVNSHPHPDHLLGLASAAAGIPVGRFLDNGRDGSEEMAAARARLPPRAPWRPGESLERAGVRLLALAPPPGSEAWSENDASLVLRVEHGKVAFLLLGDVEEEGEEALLASGAPLAADVVKVPHHGSRTSSGPGLVAASRARFAVISVGRRNPFGLPSAEVLERWRAAGAEVLRTDQGGAVRFLSDGERVWRAPAEGAIDAWAMWGEKPTPTVSRRGGRPPSAATPTPTLPAPAHRDP
jgi:competence protein ComEC